jgi:aminomethyltransferase
MLCVNAANIDKDWAHICRQGEEYGMRAGEELENASDKTAQLAI